MPSGVQLTSSMGEAGRLVSGPDGLAGEDLDAVAVGGEAVGEGAAEEAGAAGDDDAHGEGYTGGREGRGLTNARPLRILTG